VNNFEMLLRLFLLVAFISRNTRGDTCDPYSDVCSMQDADVLFVFCDDKGANCVCTDIEEDACKAITDGDSVVNGDATPLTNESLDKDVCEALCTTQAAAEGQTKLCSRWQRKAEEFHAGDAVTCTMRSDPCPGPEFCISNYITCDSGHINCGATDPPTEKPQEQCKGKIGYDASLVHWDCRDVHQEYVNVYVVEVIPENTVCQTMKRCSEWNENERNEIRADSKSYRLVVNCDGDTGLWQPDENTGDMELTKTLIEETDDEKNTLLEVDLEKECHAICQPEQLDEEKMTERGAEAICDQGLIYADYVLEGDNSCILMCDRELQKQIDCLFDEDSIRGEKAWYDTNKDSHPKPDDATYSGEYFKYENPLEEFICDWGDL